MSDLLNLIDKLEKAEAGSRELDNDIWEALDLGVVQHPWGKEYTYARHVTTSLDAAIALVDRVFRNNQKVIRTFPDGTNDVVMWNHEVGTDTVAGATVALSLCTALLKALQAKEAGQ